MAIGHEAQQLAIDQCRNIQVFDGAGNLRTQAMLGVFRLECNARTPFAQAIKDFSLVVAQAGDYSHASDYYTTHYRVLPNK